MIALQRIRDEPELIREGARLKGEPAPVDEILELDAQARALRSDMEALRADQNRETKEIRGKPTDEQRERLAGFKRRIQEAEESVGALEARVQALLLVVPNPPHPSVPAGTSDADNVTVRTWGEPARFDFTPRPHHELGEALGIFDFERAAKISGARFAVLRGDGARLQRALVTYMLDLATTRHGYSEIAPPYLVRREAMVGTGNLPKFEDDAFHTEGDMFLIPTAEVPVTNLYREEILDGDLLPIRHVAYTPCWRREAGAAGKDTRGYVRLHQFDKVELVKFVDPETSLDELEGLVGDAEAVLQGLGIHYRVLLMCTGDMGFAQWKKYDLEAWCPGMDRWLEVSSCSVFADFQARRADIRYRPAAQAKPRFVHTLNGSALAVPRTFDAVLETFQQEDGSVGIPDALRRYMDGQERLCPR
ncbi:MAG: serine--tRNA ligase [Chloroflexi bacterium]|nr:MAG: serine--tRNA ligase [Chloroflexota bacterium]